MGRIAREFDYELVMVTNQDGLGTDAFPEASFWPVQELVMKCFADEGIHFSAVHIDRTFPNEHAATRKPGTGMLTAYLNNPAYDMANSFVIGDRITDVQLAKNLGCKAFWLNNEPGLGAAETSDSRKQLDETIALETTEWEKIYEFMKLGLRTVVHDRNTHETQIHIRLNIDGDGKSIIHTGLGFFDHMLDQLARHGKMDLEIKVNGDLQIDEHHTIEDTAIALGEAIGKCLADKRGMERYGFALPRDDADAKVLIDFGGRNWIVWNASFSRERIGEMQRSCSFISLNHFPIRPNAI